MADVTLFGKYAADLVEDIEYPDSDGEPVAESDFQLEWLLYLVDVLRDYFSEVPDVYVAGDLLLYYEEGDRTAKVAPDVFVVRGIENRKRFSFKLWEERKAPDFVMEITSKSTFNRDQTTKWGLYSLLGIEEYFLFDPTNDYLEPQLQGYQLRGRGYEPIPAELRPDGTIIVSSKTLGLDFHLLDDELRLVVPESGQALPTYQEIKRAYAIAVNAQHRAEERAQKEAHARRELEARVAELEARLRKEGKE